MKLIQANVNDALARRIRNGYPWVPARNILSWKIPGNDDPIQKPPAIKGDLVEVYDATRTLLGYGCANTDAVLAVRMLYSPRAGKYGTQHPDEEAELHRKLDRARSRRLKLALDSNAWRLVWSEADGLPGFICDCYASTLVVQFLTAGMDRRRAYLLDWLQTRMKPAGIFERSDGQGRLLEGLSPKQGWLWQAGDKALPTTVDIQEGPNRYRVDIGKGHKTGFYLDQRAARRLVRQQALHGRVLDCFCNTGGFSVAAAWAGADLVQAVDTSGTALAALEQNAALNDLTGKIEGIKENVFAYLTEMVKRRQSYTMIILDPPPFARTREEVPDALRGYRELHRRAAQLLAPQGLLITCSCSHHVSAVQFKQTLQQGMKNAGRHCKILSHFGPDEDHPEKAQIPGSRYLNCLFASVR